MATCPTRWGGSTSKRTFADSAISIFRELVKNEPERAMYRYHFAMALYQKGDVDPPKRNCEAH